MRPFFFGDNPATLYAEKKAAALVTAILIAPRRLHATRRDQETAWTAAAATRQYSTIALLRHRHDEWRRHYYFKQFAILAFFFMNTMAIQRTLPDEDSYARQQFQRNKKDAFFRWTFILLATGFAGALSPHDNFVHRVAARVERRLADTRHTVFETNENWVFFRGETEKEAESALINNRIPLPWRLLTGEFGGPDARDATLSSDDDPLPADGYSAGLVSLTSDLQRALGFYQQAVFVLVPSRVAAAAQHATKASQGGEYEYYCGAFTRDRILGIAYADPNTGNFARFVLNPSFTGNVAKLVLDPQMQTLVDLLPDHEPMKARLADRITPTLRYQDHYEAIEAPSKEAHARVLPARKVLAAQAQKQPLRFGSYTHETLERMAMEMANAENNEPGKAPRI